MKRAVLFLGSAGAGKSTLINKLTAPRSDAVVSNRKVQDGTTGAATIQGLDNDMSFIDTVGLDSNNYTSHVTENFHKDHVDKKVLLVLVIIVQMSRLTSFLSKFNKVIGDLVGDKPFFIVWTHCSPESGLSSDDLADMKTLYPKAHMFYDATPENIDGLKRSFADAALFLPVKASVPKPSAATSGAVAFASPVVAKFAGNSVKVKSSGRPRKLLGPPHFLLTMDGFRCKPNNKGQFDDYVQEVLQIKKGDAKRFRRLKLMGDAALKSFVLRCLEASGYLDVLEEKADLVTTNNPTGAMARFFDLYIAKHHDKVLPNEAADMATAVGSHGKADVVEALLEYTGSVSGSQGHAYAYRHIMAELFKLAGLPDVLKCTA
jgi:adenylylsulfate kinase-like enzyme